MTLLERLWNGAKLGTTIGIGPVAMSIRFSRAVKVSHQRSPWRHRLPRPAPKAISSDAPGATDRGRPTQARRSNEPRTALVVGTGPGLGSALARRFAAAGLSVAVAARNTEKLGPLLAEIRAKGGVAAAFGCDATSDRSVKTLMKSVTSSFGIPDVVFYNVDHFVPGSITEIETPAFEECWRANCLGAFLTGREAARVMLSRGSGTIIFTGATGAIRGGDGFINLAVGKFGTRALAQSIARELNPKGIHVAHVIIDGGMSAPSTAAAAERVESLFPDDVAETYFHLYSQHPSAWTHELDLRPWVEKF
jgi:NAD(P)-dependent dehydrogenase (short-subunit alcohol dehydrogenase family)